ncbi:glycoside hydrolase family 95 protein [Prevotella fusca JCM 17724]|uniref:Fibronectin n=1 Tax=Prevotella fusca JCM 17724 TaxID=1236517 RepID=A0A0K1NPI6_9BACT|nr:glycoside hydrolase family 95 protein [Prevotella fusca]AKU70596.1 fibronectin [Prevotella fusca JCM 17724]QUB85276.1 glycoside hydrolase family 95 protein [Prevotella fusca JCM 17724]
MSICKCICAAFMTMFLSASPVFAQGFPRVSTSQDEHWYYVKYLRSGNVLEDKGNKQNCRTASPQVMSSDRQLWKVVAAKGSDADRKYQLVSRSGRTLYVNGTDPNSSRFMTGATAAGTNTFHIFHSSNNSFGSGAFEIAPDSTGSYAMNQVGEIKVGQLVGLWDKGDINNVLSFVTKDDMVFPYYMPVTSTAANPVYYYIQFQTGNWLLSAKDEKATCQTASLHTGNLDDMFWRVSESNGKYAFVSKSGKILYINDSYLNASKERSSKDTLFTMVESKNALGGFEIGKSTYGRNFFNMYQGAGEGKYISFWDLGDGGNVVRFVPADELVPVEGIATFSPANKYTLWYTKPATNWMTSCLPIGNGQFGATLMGDVAIDDVQFNDKTLWSGKLGGLTSTAAYGYYLNFGNLYIRSRGLSKVTDYVRYLDINDAVAGVKYTMDGVEYNRTYFASNPDSCVVIRYTASQGGKINTTLTLRNQNGRDVSYTVDNNNQATITFDGQVARQNDYGATTPESYYCAARIVTDGGTVTKNAKGMIEVNDANSMTVYLRGLTDFDPDAPEYVSGANLLAGRAAATVDGAQGKGYDVLFAAHKTDYKSLFERCQLTLGDIKNNIPTPQLISNYRNNQHDNLFLEELYFNYGRYLLISSSRGVSLPANLQGIWNDNNTPAWHSDIHANINVQMNYWPAEPTNLSELHRPFLDYIYREACVKPTWRRFAQDMGHVNTGWTLPTENNIYGSGTTFANTYTVANAWYCQHLWQHYTYTMDKEFLRTKAFPAMKSAVDYWFKKLVKAADGTYECPNEWSPEHGPTENATAHSQQLVWDLFNNTRKAIGILGNDVVSKAFRDELASYFEKLDNGCHTEVNPADGKTYLREWKYTSQFNNPSKIGVNEYKAHRHISHLMGLYPCTQISEDVDNNVFEAARASLIARGDGHGTGWSLGHKINLNARAYEGLHCHNLIKRALQQTWDTGTNEAAGGIYENLWDAHAPYQIDGNFGYTAGVAEMLLQSHNDKLVILPALPTTFWQKGSVKGLKAVGNFTVDIEWANAKATKVQIVSNVGTTCVVKYAGIAKNYKVTTADGKTVKVKRISDDEISFPTVKGGEYVLVSKEANAIVALQGAQDSSVASVCYYSLDGTKAAESQSRSVYIKQMKYSNGSTSTTKVIN